METNTELFAAITAQAWLASLAADPAYTFWQGEAIMRAVDLVAESQRGWLSGEDAGGPLYLPA